MEAMPASRRAPGAAAFDRHFAQLGPVSTSPTVAGYRSCPRAQRHSYSAPMRVSRASAARCGGATRESSSERERCVSWLTSADKQKIYEDNIKRVYPCVSKRLAKAGVK